MKLYGAAGRVLVGALLLFTGAARAAGSGEGFDWLKVAIIAGHQTNFSGVFVYQHGNFVETSRITHVVGKDGEYERLESLDGPKREIVRHHGEVWSYAGHELVQLDMQSGIGKFPSLLPEQLNSLSANYHAELQGIERVAGYNAQAILFTPKDNFRYRHKIWVHNDSGVLLKAAVLGNKQELIEQYAFTQVQIGGRGDHSWVKRDTRHGTKIHDTDRVGVPVNSGWVADGLPTGFQKIMEIQRPMHGNHAPVTQIVYSDGFGAMSLFFEVNDNDDDDIEGLSSRGAVSLYHKVVGDHLFTVVGEVPPHTVMRVLNSIRYNGK
ncbi:MAG TPA: MucB/RseB C-terminal domain-containing protein [Gallionella sp.]